jgi:photosystem II stability/assembly factor-like uncharacterized protein
MLRVLRLAAIAASLAVVGCAGVAVDHRADSARHFDPERGETDLHRADEPDKAQQFWDAQRAAAGETAIDNQRYVEAIEHAAGLPWYSAATGSAIPSASKAELAQLDAWQPLGPGNIGGRTRSLRFQPGNPNTMFVAGVDGGLWKSTDAGASWKALTDLAPNLAIVSILIDRTNPLRMWVGTGEGVFNGDARRGAGIFYSLDGGLSFNQLLTTANSDFHYVNDLIQSPNATNTLYAATRTGVWRTLDSGATWTRVVDTTASGSNLGAGCFSLVAKPGVAPDLVLAACGSFGYNAAFSVPANGIVYRNPDAGGAGIWSSVLSVVNQGRTTLAVAPSDPATMYALVAQGEQPGGSTYNDGLLGVWISTDSGATWTPKVQTISSDNRNNFLLLSNPVYGRLSNCGFGTSQYLNQGWYDNVIAVDPTDANRVWVGGTDLWRSDDGGSNWGVASYWWFDKTDPNYAHADNHSITFHPGYNGTSNQQLFVTNDGGIFRSDNAAATVGTDASAGTNNSICGNVNLPAVTWNNLNNGYAVTQYYDGAVYPDNSAYIAGAQDNGTNRGTDAAGPNGWTSLLGGDGGYVAVDPTNPQKLYGEFTGFSMQRSINGGASFVSATNGIASDGALFINPFYMDANLPSRLYTGGFKLWRTDDSMATWTRAYSLILPGSGYFGAFAVAPRLPNLLLAGTTDGNVYKLTAATTATAATAAPAPVKPRLLNANYVSSLAFDGTQNGSNPNTRRAVIGYSSFNTGGATPQESHVFLSNDGGATWTGIDGMTAAGPSANGLPDVPVNDVLIDPTTSNAQRIFVGTDIGVFVTTDGGASWSRENTGFANTAVVRLKMQVNPTTHAWELFAFTHGRSVYKTTVQPGEYIFANGFD